MDIFSLAITGLLAAAIIYLIFRLPLAIFGNLRRGQRFREQLGTRLGDLRLSRMLGVVGINHSDYLHRQDTLTIRQQMTRCEQCGEKARCDELLDSPVTAETADLGFCANADGLRDIQERHSR